MYLRNLCALDWMEANPRGLAGDFKSYFDRLSKDELKVQFCLPNAYTQFLTLHCYIHQKWKEKEKAAASVSFIQIFVHLMICSLLQKARGTGTKKDMVVTETGNEGA